MAKLTQQIQKSFIERLGQLTRSTTSLRARMRQRFEAFSTPTEAEAEPAPAQALTRVSAAPDGECLYAIGDIHGRHDLLERLIDQIKQDRQTLPEGTKCTIVFLGDYIDRGLQSRSVIDFLISDRLDSFETVFLMADEEFAHVSSTLIKQIAQFSDDEMLARFVPEQIIEELRAKMTS